MISFLVGHEAHIDHYQNIWENLSPQEFTIVLLKHPYNNFLNTKRVNNLMSKYNYIYLDSIGDSTFGTCISMWPVPEVFKTDIYKKNFKQHILYSIIGSEDLITENNEHIHYNKVLVFGEYSYNFFLDFFKKEKIKVIGNPRFDKINLNKFNKKKYSILKNLYSILKKKKQNILYCPSHGGYGSIETFVRNISFSLRFFNFYVKPHLDIEFESPQSLEILKNLGCKIVNEDFFKSVEFENVDLVISDYGGSSLLPVFFSKAGLILRGNKVLNLQRFLIDKGVPSVSKKNFGIKDIIFSLTEKNVELHCSLSKIFYSNKKYSGIKIASYLKHEN